MNFKLEVKLDADFELGDIFSYYDSISKALGEIFLLIGNSQQKTFAKIHKGLK